MLFITTSVNLSKHFCVKFQYVTCYVVVEVIDIYIKNNKGHNIDQCKSKFHVLGKKVGGNLIGSVEV